MLIQESAVPTSFLPALLSGFPIFSNRLPGGMAVGSSCCGRDLKTLNSAPFLAKGSK